MWCGGVECGVVEWSGTKPEVELSMQLSDVLTV